MEIKRPNINPEKCVKCPIPSGIFIKKISPTAINGPAIFIGAGIDILPKGRSIFAFGLKTIPAPINPYITPDIPKELEYGLKIAKTMFPNIPEKMKIMKKIFLFSFISKIFPIKNNESMLYAK